jgi:hypothetical protein
MLSTREIARFQGWLNAEASTVHDDSRASSRTTPSGFVEARVATVTAGNFHLAAAARYSPATTWTDPSSPTTMRLHGIQRLDVSANKPFWHERVRAQLIIRNLLDTEETYHPLGAEWGLRTHLALTVALPPYAQSPAGNAR